MSNVTFFVLSVNILSVVMLNVLAPFKDNGISGRLALGHCGQYFGMKRKLSSHAKKIMITWGRYKRTIKPIL